MSTVTFSFCKYSLTARDLLGPAGDGRSLRPGTWQCDQGLVPRTRTPERRAARNLPPQYLGVSRQPFTWFLGGGGSAVARVLLGRRRCQRGRRRFPPLRPNPRAFYPAAGTRIRSRRGSRSSGGCGWVEWYLGLPPCIWAVKTPNLCHPGFH